MREKSNISFLKFVLLLFLTLPMSAQKGSFSGGFQNSSNLFMRDSLIGAANIPQYEGEFFGKQSWLDLGYNIKGFDFGLRLDMFHNSNLLNPNASYSDAGIGRWHIEKQFDKVQFKIGHIYDQIGSGIIYRAYEERALLIDNALFGGRVMYNLSDNWQVKAFGGRQRNLFSTYEPLVSGVNLEGFIDLGDPEKGKIFTLAPGIGMVNRKLTTDIVETIANSARNYTEVDRFLLYRCTNAFSLFNTLTMGPISFYTELAYKAPEQFFDPNAMRTLQSGQMVEGKWVREGGTVFYSSLSYAGGGLGVTVEGKRTQNFDFRADPQLLLLQGLITYIPPMNRNNTYRLTARYSPATQLLSEQAYQVDVKYRWNKKLTTSANYSSIQTLDGERLYQEIYTEVFYKYKRKWQLKTGLQFQTYNQKIYEFKPGVPNVQTVTPYIDFVYKISRKKSIRLEAQMLNIGDDEKAGYKQDYGSWFFALVEYAIAPHWSFVASDMYNTQAGKNTPTDENGDKVLLHYPRFDIYYTYKSHRFSASYIKQVEGIVCNGGICRLEPAFSGVNFTINSTF